MAGALLLVGGTPASQPPSWGFDLRQTERREAHCEKRAKGPIVEASLPSPKEGAYKSATSSRERLASPAASPAWFGAGACD